MKIIRPILYLEKIEHLSFRVDIDTHDNLKDLILHCEVYTFKDNEYVCTLRANTFSALQDMIIQRFCC